MNTTKFNKYLKKIKTFEGLVDDLDNLSLVEQDLLKDYIKKLYESVSEQQENHKTGKKTKKHKKDSVSLIENIKIEEEKNVVEKISDSEEKETIEEPVEKKEIITKVEPEEEKEETKEEPQTVSQDFLDLFELTNSNELSHKLSLIPIKQLTKAFSINEKIFTVKELFNGNKDLFNRVLEELDGLNSLEEAKEYLIKNVVNQQDWDNPKMLKKVKGFVSIVKRRFL